MPNITSIECDRHRNDINFNNKLNQVFQPIIENCNDLSEINVKNEIIDSSFEEFYGKFGSKVK